MITFGPLPLLPPLKKSAASISSNSSNPSSLDLAPAVRRECDRSTLVQPEPSVASETLRRLCAAVDWRWSLASFATGAALAEGAAAAALSLASDAAFLGMESAVRDLVRVPCTRERRCGGVTGMRSAAGAPQK